MMFYPVLDLPNEVLLIIVSLLDVPTIISLRKVCAATSSQSYNPTITFQQTCTSFKHLSHDRSLWLAIIHHQKYDLDLPLPQYTYNPSSLLDMPTSKLEEVVVSAHRVHRSWLLRRSPDIHATARNLSPKPGQYLHSLDIFLDRWLLCVYYEGIVSLWDIGTSDGVGKEEEWQSPSRFCVLHQRLNLRGETAWSSCVTALDVGGQAIILACSNRVDG